MTCELWHVIYGGVYNYEAYKYYLMFGLPGERWTGYFTPLLTTIKCPFNGGDGDGIYEVKSDSFVR